MKEEGKTITESIDQGTPMGKMLGGWTGNQAEVDKAVQSKLSNKSLTCDALDAYYKLARAMEKQEPSACRLPKYNEFRKGVGKKCKAYKVVSAASEKAMKFAKGCKCTLQDFNDVTVFGIDPEKVTIHRVGRYFEARVVLEGSVEWPGFSSFTTCFLNGMRTLLGREVIVDKVCLGRICGFISIQFRFAKNAKPAKKRR